MRTFRPVRVGTGAQRVAPLLVFLLILAGGAGAVTQGGSTASFLRISPMARPAAMGNAYTGLAEGIESLNFNPAGLTTIDRWDAGLAQIVQPLGARFSYLSAARRFSSSTVGALQLSYVGIEDEYRDIFGNVTGKFTNYDLSPGLSVAHQLTPEIAVGGTVRIISSELAGFKASTVSGDIGIKYNPIRIPSVSLGVAALNIGPGLTYDQISSPLPWTLRIGGAWHPDKGRYVLASDLSVDRDGQPRLHLGSEMRVFEGLALRAGFDLGSDVSLRDALKLGLGFQSTVGSFDYAFESVGEVGNIHRFSYSYLGGLGKYRGATSAADKESFFTGAEDGGATRRVAVLPFVSLSPDPEIEWLAEGFREIFLSRMRKVATMESVAPSRARYVIDGRYSLLDPNTLWVGVRVVDPEKNVMVGFREVTIPRDKLLDGGATLAGVIFSIVP